MFPKLFGFGALSILKMSANLQTYRNIGVELYCIICNILYYIILRLREDSSPFHVGFEVDKLALKYSGITKVI